RDGINRRSFVAQTVLAGAGVAAVAAQNAASTQTGGQIMPRTGAQRGDTRRLGKLEVSSVGLGVQNMHRKYDTSVPYRPEMISILRAAYDRGITFFDTAEAYGPFENERMLGLGLEPFRIKA